MAGRQQHVDLGDRRRRIEDWRKTRRKRHPMPAELWTAAVLAAREHGAYQTAKALKVNYQSLRTRSEAGGKGAEVTQSASFVELTPLGAVGERGPMVELSDSSGRRLTVRIGGEAQIDIVALVHELWSCSR